MAATRSRCAPQARVIHALRCASNAFRFSYLQPIKAAFFCAFPSAHQPIRSLHHDRMNAPPPHRSSHALHPARSLHFSFSFLFSAYWLLLLTQFKIRSRSPRVDEPPAPAPASPPHGQVWRRLGAFIALVCAGKLMRACIKKIHKKYLSASATCCSPFIPLPKWS